MKKESRREFIRKTMGVASVVTIAPFLSRSDNPAQVASVNFQLPPLPYPYDALEPYIDTETMQIHHSFHHGAYVANLNKALAESHVDRLPSLEEFFTYISAASPAIRNNAGGHWNHMMFWDIMKPGGKKMPEGELMEAIKSRFSSFDEFKRNFAVIALSHFGSGWAWLVIDETKRLNLFSTPNQDNPLMDISPRKGYPILGLDLWEHAYYLKYRYKRYEYLDAWWNVVNWDEVMKRYHQGMRK